jgi:hypothetical protein
MRAAAKAKPKVKAQKAIKTPAQSLPKSVAGVNRSEGIRLFKVAGRPTRAQFVAVFGPNGPRMTNDLGAAGGGGCTSREVSGCACRESRLASRSG